MAFTKIKDKWIPSYSRKTIDLIISPNTRQTEWYHKEEFDKIFPDFVEGDEVIANSHTVPPVLFHMRATESGNNLPPGIYINCVVDMDMGLMDLPVYTDRYLPLYNGHQNLLEDVGRFFDKRQKYLDLGIAHRRGALLYGPPGNGKTRMAVEVARTVVANGSVAILYNDPHSHTLLEIGRALDNFPCVIIIEELTSQNDLAALLSFLDGEESWDNVYVIATTNYPEQLDANIVDRPGRFDLLQEFPHPDKDQREFYFKHFLHDVPANIVGQTEGYSIAYLKHLISEHLVYGRDFDTIIAEMVARKRVIKNNFMERGEGLSFRGMS